MKKIITSILLLALMAGTLHAQKNVIPLPLDSTVTVKGNTLQYALPTTALKMTVTVAKIQEVKGYYADYAQSLLGLSNIITENKSYYALKNVSVKPVDVPDYDHTYLVVLSPNQNKKNLLGKLATCKKTQADIHHVGQYSTATAEIPAFFKNYSDLSYTQTEDAFVETKIIDGVVTQIPSNRTRTVSKTSSQKAQEAADAISKSRKDQYSLIAGEQETPYSPETMEAMLKELKEWENNYLSLFTGLKLEDETEYTFYIIPDAQNPTPAFAFDVYHGFSTAANASAGNLYSITLDPVFEAKNNYRVAESTSKTSGYRYRKAVPAQVTLWHENVKEHDFGVLNIRQLGEIKVLPAKQDQLDIRKIGIVL